MKYRDYKFHLSSMDSTDGLKFIDFILNIIHTKKNIQFELSP